MIVGLATSTRVSGLPALVAVAPASIAAVVVSDPDLGRYRELTGLDHPALAIGAIVLVAVSAGIAARRSSAVPRGPAVVTSLMFVAVSGVFLCVPETNLLRLLPAPILVVAVAGWWRKVQPLAAASVTVITATVGWVAVVDGQARPASIVGAVACLGALSMIALRPLSRDGSPFGLWRNFKVPVVTVLIIAVSSRVIGVGDYSVQLSTAMAGALFAVALAAIGVRSASPSN